MFIISPTPFSLCFALLLCLPLAVFFTSTTTTTTTTSPPPPNPTPVPLPRDDESLLRLASRVNSEPLPSNAPKKIAFMFLTTATTSLPLAPLWELFFHPNQTQLHNKKQKNDPLFNIYIHASSDSNSTSMSPIQAVQGVFSNRIIHSNPTKRHSPTLIAAARRLLAHALLHDSANTMFALLSPSCIPLHSFNFTYTTLINASSNKSFIEILKDEPGDIDRWLARGGAEIMLPEVPFHSFRIGSQFFVLTRKHAKLVVKDTRLWSKFKLPCVRWDVCYPEEHYFPSLLSTQDPRGCVPATLTHVDWKGRSDGHPRTYAQSEVGAELIFKLRRATLRYGHVNNDNGDDCGGGGNRTSNSSSRHEQYPFLFARKFSPESLGPLMNIANDVVFRD